MHFVTKTETAGCIGTWILQGDTTTRGAGPNEMGANLPFISLGTSPDGGV